MAQHRLVLCDRSAQTSQCVYMCANRLTVGDVSANSSCSDAQVSTVISLFGRRGHRLRPGSF